MLRAILALVLVGADALAAAKKGFGAKPEKKRTKATLGGGAKRLLAEHGDLDAAQAARFDEYLGKLEASDAALHAEVVAARAGGGSRRGRDALCAATWDTIADFAPLAGRDAAMDANLARIAAAASPGAVLDVGCGDGALVPCLARAGADMGGYVGVDLSRRMVAAAEARHPARTFVAGSFLDLEYGRTFDSVVFSGALQFFPDPKIALDACRPLLADGGAVVVAHVRGAAFVREEARDNPALVIPLPDVGAYAALGYDVVDAAPDPERFYLARLRPKA